MSDGKWITGLTPDTPLEDAARRVLELRLGVVRKHLSRAIQQAHKDVEHVHRLRVATRRARAAIEIFACCLSARLHRRLRKALRRIRRSAGDARDCDVFLPRLRDHLTNASDSVAAGLHWIAGQLSAARARAQKSLVAQGAPSEARLRRLLAELRNELRELGERGEQSLGLRAHAGPQLLYLVQELQEQASGDWDDPVRLHQMRIRGKRLRYAIELFQGAFSAALKRELYPLVEEMQDILGGVNDHAVAIQRLNAIREQARRFEPEQWRMWQPGVEVLLRAERRQLAAGRRDFRRFWERWLKGGVGPRFREAVSS